MICPRCGATVPQELPICGTCGTDLSTTQPGGRTPSSRPGVPATGSGSLRLGPRQQRGARSTRSGLPYQPGETVLNRYRVDHVLGEGPVSAVYGATDLDADVPVALKVVLSEYLPDPGSLRRIGRALRPARELSHENIIRLYDISPHESRFVLVEQLVVGRSLSELLAERLPQGIRSPVDETRALLTQIGEALAYSHPEIPHTALKPTNVLILPAGVLLTDFCMGSAIDPRAYLAGHRHHQAPTRYLAPEYRRGEEVDARADLFGLAVIAFELLLGVPYPGRERAQAALDQLPPEARSALESALSDRPRERPGHVDDLVEALLSALESGEITAPRAATVSEHTNVLDLADLEEVVDDEPTPVEREPDLALLDEDHTVPNLSLPEAMREPSEPRAAHSPLQSPDQIPPAYDSMPGLSRRPTIGSGGDPEAFIEGAAEIEQIPDIDADGKRPNGPLSASSERRSPLPPPKAEDVIARMDFEASLNDALASVAKAPAPPPAARRRRRKRPHEEPDADAMKNRPVAARGEIQAARGSENAPEGLDPGEPAVAVNDDALPQRREGTAQIPIPPEPSGGLSWWVYLLVFAVACAVVVAGLVLLKRHRDRQLAEQTARRRAHLAALRLQKLRTHVARRAPVVAVRPLRPVRRRAVPRHLVWRHHCPLGMVRVRSRRHRIRVCVDRYEYPNRKGSLPEIAVDEETAEAKCKKWGKRLCTRAEWTLACESRKALLFSYGHHYRDGACNTAGPKGARRSPQPSGANPACRSRAGIYDLNGNLAEWVSGGVLMGGSAAKPGTQTSCESDTGSGGTRYNGFRCCVTAR